VSLKK
jgi:hypothetical protein